MILHNNMMMVIRRKEPFYTWVKMIVAAQDLMTEQQLNELGGQELKDINPSSYLIPLFETQALADQYVKDNFREIFANEITQWCIDQTLWPKDMALEAFYEWFDVEFHSAVISFE